MSGSNSSRPGGRAERIHEGRVTPLLASGALLVMLAAQLLLPIGGVDPVVPGLAARRGRPITIPAPVDVRALLAAPIFAPDRRPAAGTSTSTQATAPLAGYAALGAAISRQGATAVISGPGAPAQVMHRGDIVAGWRLVGIDRLRLTFERQGERHSLIVGAPAAPIAQPDAATQ